MNNRVLFVDDEPNILQAIKRSLRKDFEVVIAVGPEAGLKELTDSEPFAMIVSDMRMPGMSGVDFLQASKQLSPNSVRVMLTGNHDQKTAMDAVNDGEVFRFLTKPCDVTTLRQVIQQGLRQYQLLTVEEELLENTLKGSLAVVSEMLSLVKPQAFGRTERLKRKVLELLDRGSEIDARQHWEIETGTMLSQLGSVSISDDLIGKIAAGDELSFDERASYEKATSGGARLLASIPRMENIAAIIRYQHKRYDGGGIPADDVKAEKIPLGSRALRIVLAYDELKMRGLEGAELYDELKTRRGEFDPRLLELLAEEPAEAKGRKRLRVPANKLVLGMVIEQDVESDWGSLLVCEGQEVTDTIREHLMKFFMDGKLKEQISVSIEDTEVAIEMAEAS